MKLCKRGNKIENISWWTSDYYTRRLSLEERDRRTHTYFIKERGENGTPQSTVATRLDERIYGKIPSTKDTIER